MLPASHKFGPASTDKVYEIACEMSQESRSPSLLQRP